MKARYVRTKHVSKRMILFDNLDCGSVWDLRVFCYFNTTSVAKLSVRFGCSQNVLFLPILKNIKFVPRRCIHDVELDWNKVCRRLDIIYPTPGGRAR